VVVADLGHEEPTILLTNQLTRPAAKSVERYAQPMIIENMIADGIDFFHMDALGSAVAMKVNCELPLTLMASSLYRLLAGRIGRGYARTESRHLFQDFVNATADVRITGSDIVVRYQKRAHNPPARRGRFRYDRDGGPLAGPKTSAPVLRIARSRPSRRAWCKAKN
jgi:hypothetical protein